jgi:hypothetical protein
MAKQAMMKVGPGARCQKPNSPTSAVRVIANPDNQTRVDCFRMTSFVGDIRRPGITIPLSAEPEENCANSAKEQGGSRRKAGMM